MLAALGLSTLVTAKRVTPKPVDPVVANGVEYSAPLIDGRVGTVVATDVQTHKQLWSVEVFRVHLNPLREEDNQWVFITNLSLEGDSILVRNEAAHCYRVDLKTKTVKRVKCAR